MLARPLMFALASPLCRPLGVQSFGGTAVFLTLDDGTFLTLDDGTLLVL